MKLPWNFWGLVKIKSTAVGLQRPYPRQANQILGFSTQSIEICLHQHPLDRVWIPNLRFRGNRDGWLSELSREGIGLSIERLCQFQLPPVYIPKTSMTTHWSTSSGHRSGFLGWIPRSFWAGTVKHSPVSAAISGTWVNRLPSLGIYLFKTNHGDEIGKQLEEQNRTVIWDAPSLT